MTEENSYVGGSGPLIVLQEAAVTKWRGANDFENSLLNGGNVETDYDVACQCSEGDCVDVATRYDRDLLVLWQGAFAAMLLSPQSLGLPDDDIVIAMGYAPEDLPDIFPKILERVARGQPERTISFHVQDSSLRLQAAADSSDPSYAGHFLDMPIAPGWKQCDVYFVEHDDFQDELVVIRKSDAEAASA